MSLQVIVTTCDKYLWLMPGFFHQWNKYCGLAGMVVCEHDTPELPDAWSYFRAGRDTTTKGWVGNLRETLKQVHAEMVLLVLDDYWLTQWADMYRIYQLRDWMMESKDIDKIDLTNDRVGFPHIPLRNHKHGQDYVQSKQDAPYLTSTQAAIWRTSFLNECLLDPSWNPWQFEINGSEHTKTLNHTILGCSVPVMHYANVVLKGQINQVEVNRLSEGDKQELTDIGAFQNGETK